MRNSTSPLATLRRRPMILSSLSISPMSRPIGRHSWCMLQVAQRAFRISMVAPGRVMAGSWSMGVQSGFGWATVYCKPWAKPPFLAALACDFRSSLRDSTAPGKRAMQHAWPSGQYRDYDGCWLLSIRNRARGIMKPLGIKAKVALATTLTSIVMIALVTALQAQRMRADFTRVLFAQQDALVSRTAQDLDDKLTMLRDIVAQSARYQPRELCNNPAGLRGYYDNRAVLSLFDDVLVVSPQGIVIADIPALPGRPGISVVDRAYFKHVMKERQAIIAEPVLGKAGGKPVVQMVAPVLGEEGDVRCIVIGVLRLYRDNLLGHLRTAKVGNIGYYYAVTRSATPVYVLHPQLDRMLTLRSPRGAPALTAALATGFEGTQIGPNVDGIRMLTSVKRLKSVPWILAASLPEEEAFAPFVGAQLRLALWGTLASLAAAAIIALVTLRLMSPLVHLRDAIRAL